MVMKPRSMPDGVVQHLGHRRQAVGGAGGVRDHEVLGGQLVVVDAVDHGEVGAVGGRRDDHALGAGIEMGLGLVLRGEDAGAFERDVDAEFAVRQLGRVAHGRDLDALAVDDEELAVDLDLAGESAVDGIEAQQVGVGLDRAEIVDRHDLDVLAAGFVDGAQHVAADASEPVDGNLTSRRDSFPDAGAGARRPPSSDQNGAVSAAPGQRAGPSGRAGLNLR